MSYTNLAGYIRPGHPREYANDSLVGNTYLYRNATSTIDANVPAVGETWADGRPVISREKFEHGTVSGVSDLLVVTGANVTYSGTLGTPAAEEVVYELEWRPVQQPLEVHPDFGAGGTYALDEAAKGDILGWRAELDPRLKKAYKYKPLDSNGTPGAEVTITGTGLDFVKLLAKGVEEYVEYMPIWRRRSMYRGSVAPASGAIGVYTATPEGTGYPSGYEWVKSKDSVQRVGRSSKWRRDEEWEGADTVWADKTDVYPPL